MLKQLKKSSGAVSTILLVLAVVLILVIIVVFFVVKIAAVKTAGPAKSPAIASGASQTPPPPPAPVHQATLGDVKFTFESAQDLGNTMTTNDQGSPETLTTTEKFIEVTIGAQNEAKMDIPQGSWALGNIIDSDGRNFVTIDDQASYFLPDPNLCGSLLKPNFTPVPCISFYEVSKASAGLKLQVIYTDPNSGSQKQALLDLVVQ